MNEYELKIYWDDDVTVECRYFSTYDAALYYAEVNGLTNYDIERNI